MNKLQITASADVTFIPDATGHQAGAEHQHESMGDLENIVDFDGPDDPKDPLKWSSRYKWSMVILISVLSLIV
jgi:hypothetical protein